MPRKALGSQFHAEQIAVNASAEIAPENQRRNRHDQSESRVVQRDGDTLGELRRVACAANATGGAALRAKNLDHADHRAKQSKQGGRRGDSR